MMIGCIAGVVPRLAGRGLVMPLVLCRCSDRARRSRRVRGCRRRRASGSPGSTDCRCRCRHSSVSRSAIVDAVSHTVPPPPIFQYVVALPALGRLGELGLLDAASRDRRAPSTSATAACRLGVVGGDVAAHAIFSAAVADDDLAFDDARHRGDRVRAASCRSSAPTRLPCRSCCRGRSGGHRARRDRSCRSKRATPRFTTSQHASAAFVFTTSGSYSHTFSPVRDVERLHHAPRGSEIHASRRRRSASILGRARCRCPHTTRD